METNAEASSSRVMGSTTTNPTTTIFESGNIDASGGGKDIIQPGVTYRTESFASDPCSAAAASTAMPTLAAPDSNPHVDDNTEDPSTDQGQQEYASEDEYYIPPLTRRHSLPASYVFNIFSLWTNNETRLSQQAGSSSQSQQAVQESTVQEASQVRQAFDSREPNNDTSAACADLASQNCLKRRGTSAGHDSGTVRKGSRKSSDGNNVNRHRYGHRHTKSVVPDQPVVVKTYNPKPKPGKMNTNTRDDERERVKLPPVDAFSFNGLLKSVKPQVEGAKRSLVRFSERYQDNLKIETDVLDRMQKSIEDQMREADSLAIRALNATNERTNRIDNDMKALRQGDAVEELAQTAERAFTTLESIISSMLAIDEMLPPQERLSMPETPHKQHYPKVHRLLVDKSVEVNARFGAFGRRPSHGMPPVTPTTPHHPQVIASSPRTSFSQQEHPFPFNNRRFSTASSVASSIASHRSTGLPQLQLRTLLPPPSLPPPLVPSFTDPDYNLESHRPRTSRENTYHIQDRPTQRSGEVLQNEMKKRRGTFSFSFNNFWGIRNQDKESICEENAEQRLRRIISSGSAPEIDGSNRYLKVSHKGKGKAVDRRSVHF